MSRINVVFVCLGNICRSPLAEGAFQNLVDAQGLNHRFNLDSAGTGAWHVGEPPDPRSIRTAAQHGVDIDKQRARVFIQQDMKRFDYIFAMDLNNQRDILKRHSDGSSEKVHLFLSQTVSPMAEVPDPYYGGMNGFEVVWNFVHEASDAWLNEICKQHKIVT